ncbi:hypothetical protein [Rheinheimera fenheensis]|uniref:hypothetical protein n=1 Tax=Rheinheimera fenheensis TaxID=3152295 RepID=UPI00325C98A7
MSKLIDEELSAFLSSHVSLHLSCVTSSLRTSIVRCVGARVDNVKQKISLLIPGSQAREIIEHIGRKTAVAVVFTDPETYRSIQIKSNNATIETSVASDVQLHQDYIKKFTERLRVYNIPPSYVHTLCYCQSADLQVITLSPQQLYDQSPGRLAGTLLGTI